MSPVRSVRSTAIYIWRQAISRNALSQEKSPDKMSRRKARGSDLFAKWMVDESGLIQFSHNCVIDHLFGFDFCHVRIASPQRNSIIDAIPAGSDIRFLGQHRQRRLIMLLCLLHVGQAQIFRQNRLYPTLFFGSRVKVFPATNALIIRLREIRLGLEKALFSGHDLQRIWNRQLAEICEDIVTALFHCGVKTRIYDNGVATAGIYRSYSGRLRPHL